MARIARRFGCTMADVRAMTPEEIDALAGVIHDEEQAAERMAQARRTKAAAAARFRR